MSPAPRGHYPGPPAPRQVIGLRQAGRGDRARVDEICGEVLRSGDHLPRHFDDWIDAEDPWDIRGQRRQDHGKSLRGGF